MNRVEALDIERELFEAYSGGSPDAYPQFKEAYKVLTRLRNSIQKQNIKNKIKRGLSKKQS